MIRDLESNIERIGLVGIWRPTKGGDNREVKGILSDLEKGLASSGFGRDVDFVANYTMSRSMFDDSELFPLRGLLTIGANSFRVQGAAIGRVSVVFRLGDSKA